VADTYRDSLPTCQLPALPWPDMPIGGRDYFSAEQMRAYGRAAVRAYLEGGATNALPEQAVDDAATQAPFAYAYIGLPHDDGYQAIDFARIPYSGALREMANKLGAEEVPLVVGRPQSAGPAYRAFLLSRQRDVGFASSEVGNA